jgi:hypothetical protein
MLQLLSWLLRTLLLVAILPQATRKPYELSVHRFEAGENDGYSLRLYNTVTGTTIWSQKVHSYGTVGPFHGWSPNRRAIALPIKPFRGSEAILLWREGHKVWLCPRKRGGIDADYVFGRILWTTDNKRVLLREGGSGDADLDVGTLLCADLATRKVHFVAHGVHKMEWIGSASLHYWTAGPDKNGKWAIAPRPQTWRIP